MANKHGSLSIDSDNLFPIIKKWLYSDHDIFYRELISNGCDAITKLKKLDMMGEYSLPEGYKGRVDVIVDPEKKTLTFKDNGLGMTADEVEEYINQIAFSGATDFIEKYKDKSNSDQIIGHFGLGFYSAFMVADEVTIDTLSYKEGATAVHWSCDGGTEFDMKDGDKTTVGTEITLFLNEDCLEFANEYRAREVIEKYCSFMPTEIYLSKANAPEEYETIDKEDVKDTDKVIEEIHEEAKTEEKENDKGEKEIVEVSPAKDKVKIVKRPVPLNDTNPLWAKNPSECTDEDYKEFYRKVFMDYKEPLFWIHLNMDYPFNMKGILKDKEWYGYWQTQNLRQYLTKSAAPVGNMLPVAIAWPLLSEFIQTTEQAINGQSDNRVDLRFAHAETVIPFVALMGIGKTDIQIASPDSVSIYWKDYEIAPMAANVQWVFYRDKNCQVWVKILLNEQEVTIPVVTSFFPYYRWEEVCHYLKQRIAISKEILSRFSSKTD